MDGRDLRLSIDTRLQYLVFKELKDAMDKHQAKGATAVVLDVHTGEILALANVPTFDPNKRETFQGAKLRNQAITDTFEPGSIMKPFTAALALDLGRITPNTLFETGNGRFVYQGSTISDVSRNGTLDVAGVLRKSSNIGMTLISEKLESREMWNRFTELGLGQAPQVGFPGAAPGRLRPWERWRLIEKATMAYGYGLSVSLLQVARAYTVFARNGDMVSMTLVKRDSDPTSVRIYAQDHRAGARHAEAAAGPEAPRPRKCVAIAWLARAARRARSSTASTACSATAARMSVSLRCPIPRSSWPCPSMSRRSAATAPSPHLCSPALSAESAAYGGASRRALRIHDCCWFEGARQMNAKGFQSNSQAATVEQTVAWFMSACR